jgi:hypothetical protein
MRFSTSGGQRHLNLPGNACRQSCWYSGCTGRHLRGGQADIVGAGFHRSDKLTLSTAGVGRLKWRSHMPREDDGADARWPDGLRTLLPLTKAQPDKVMRIITRAHAARPATFIDPGAEKSSQWPYFERCPTRFHSSRLWVPPSGSRPLLAINFARGRGRFFQRRTKLAVDLAMAG